MFRDTLEIYSSASWRDSTSEVLERVAEGTLPVGDAGPLLITPDMSESDRRHLMGLALSAAGHTAEAVECLEAVVEAERDDDLALINLAAIWKSYGFRHSANLIYDRIGKAFAFDNGTSSKVIDESRDELIQREEALAYLMLRRKALEEALGRADASFGSKLELGMNYLWLAQFGAQTFEAAGELLEEANRSQADKRPILEILAWLYNMDINPTRRDQALRDLERLDPYTQRSRSKTLTEIGQPSDPGLRGFFGLLQLLVVRCVERKDGWPQALQDIREIFERLPENTLFRSQALIAELATDNVPAATRHARALAMRSELSLEEHLNVAQVLWLDGDQATARFHLECAMNLAGDEEERADVVRMVRFLQHDEVPPEWGADSD